MTKQARVPTFPTRQKARIWTGRIPGSHEPGYAEAELMECRPPEELRLAFQREGVESFHYFRFGECTVFLSREQAHGDQLRWHISISAPARHPTWDEIKAVRYRLGGPD